VLIVPTFNGQPTSPTRTTAIPRPNRTINHQNRTSRISPTTGIIWNKPNSSSRDENPDRKKREIGAEMKET